MIVVFFFFFQAEDGIRDYKVTGVQTCALPISHRERLARRGVLVVVPIPTFLRYIERVLPSLGETGVLLATTAELYPGVTATATEPPEAAALKGSERMAGILAAAVADRQRLPGEDLEIRFDGQVLRLDRRTCLRARLRARAAGTPHNQ